MGRRAVELVTVFPDLKEDIEYTQSKWPETLEALCFARLREVGATDEQITLAKKNPSLLKKRDTED